MAYIHVACPQCAKRYKVDEAHRGKKTPCKQCGTLIVIDGMSSSRPQASAATPAPAAPAPQRADPAKERPRGADGIPRDWEPGDVILDLYEVIQLPRTKHGYAEGGMGRVNLVRHREWQRDLAVKSMLPAKSASARDIEQFTTEAEQWVDAIGLHPHIVACHYVRVLGGVPRVFIEYVDGGTLQEWITSGRLYEGGPQAALARILDVAIQTAWGLHYVHELGLIHQDVKPLNVMMTADGVAKVTDFGLAGAKALTSREMVDGSGGQTLLATGAGMMTPAFCSPEQADIMAMKKGGIPSERWPKLTRRTDIWSWAVSVLHLFLGKIAWPGGQVAHLGLHFVPDEPHLPPIPPTVKDLLHSCFQRQPEDRPHDLMQVADTLQTIYQQETGQPHPRTQPKPEDLLADNFNNRAVSLMDLNKQEAAEKKWQEALRVDPHHPEAMFNWGLIQWRWLRMTDQKLLEKLREVRTSSADAACMDYLMGLVHLERADAQEAVECLRKAVAGGTGRVEITSALALAQSLSAPTEHLPRAFEGHTNGITAVSWSPDGRCALSGSYDKTIRLWEAVSGQCLRTFAGHTGTVHSVSWSPDGRCALSGSADKTLRLWEASRGQCLRTFAGHRSGVTSVSWSPDGRCALSGSNDKTVRLWKASSGQCLRIFEGHTDWVNSVSWSPDGCFGLSGSHDQMLRLWEVSSGQCLRIFAGHTDWVYSVTWSPDGRCALSGSADKTLRLWEVSSGKCLRIFEGHTHNVSDVSWHPDGRRALSGSTDETLRLWEVSSGQCLRTIAGHRSHVNAVSWSPDGRCALSGSGEKTLRLWGIAFAKQPVPLVTSMVSSVSSARYYHLLQNTRDALASNPAAAAGSLQQARQQPGCSRREEALELARLLSRSLGHGSFVEGWERRVLAGHTGWVSTASWSPDGRYVLSGSRDKTLRLWEASSGKCLRTFAGHTSEVSAVSWSPDGSCALSGSDAIFSGNDNTVWLWKLSSGECLRTFAGHRSYVAAVSWSPDGRCALSGSADKTMLLWEASNGKCLYIFKGHTDTVTALSWNPDGRCALSGSMDQTLRLWEVSSGRCLRTFEEHTSAVTAVSWSPDGCCALSGSADQTLRLWDVFSGNCLHIFEGHTDTVTSVSWSPDGRCALSGSMDFTLRLWEVSSGKCLRTFEGHTDTVTSVSWRPDGRCALSGSDDKTLRLWELDWEFEPNQPMDWDERARPFLKAFLTLHTPYVDGMVRRGKPSWAEDDFCRLLDKLGCAGYGWLRPEDVRRELEKMAATWQGPPPLL